MRKRKYVIGASVMALAVGVASVAYATNPVTQKADGSLKTAAGKIKFPKKKYVNAKVHVRTETSDGSNIPPAADHAVIDFDKDIKFNTGAFPVCPKSAIDGKSTADARKACSKSLVGTGSAELILGAVGSPKSSGVILPVSVSAFNARIGGKPGLYLHSDPGFTPVDLEGTLRKSTAGPKYGRALDVIVPPTGGSLSFFDTTVKKGKYVQGRCKQKDHRFNFHGFFHFGDTGSGTYPSTASASSKSKCKVKKHRRHRRHKRH